MRPHPLFTAAFLILGCGDSLEPADVLGSYSLATLQGQVPPRAIVDDPECRITVTGGSLTLTRDQGFELLLQEVTECPTPTAPGEVAQGWEGTYSVQDATVVLHAVGDPSLDYSAKFSGGHLTVPLGGRYGEAAFSLDE